MLPKIRKSAFVLQKIIREARRVLAILWAASVGGFVSSVSSNLLTTKTSDVRATLLVWLFQHGLPVILAVSICSLLLVSTWFFDRSEPISDNSAENYEQDRKGFINKLDADYGDIDRTKIDIPVNFRLMHDGKEIPNVSNTIYDWYKDHATPSVLILGEAGMGKTTQIYNIVYNILQEARNNKDIPLPIVLKLSSWARKQNPSLEEWIIEALKDTYKIPHSIGRYWLDKNRLRLFLDGLDEMTGEAQAACTQAINAYINDRGRASFIHVVISARQQEFQRLREYQKQRQQTPLDINDETIILPLTLQQLRHYLRARKLTYILQAVNNNAYLQDLLRIPLMLSMVVNMEETASAQGSRMTSQQKNFFQRFTSATSRSISYHEIFEQYLAVQTHSFDTSVRQQARDHLIWLAKQMSKRNQTEFDLEGLQKDWLEDKHLQPIEHLQRLYRRLAVFGLSCIVGALLNLTLNNVFGLSDIPFSIIYALLGGLVGGLLVQENNASHPLRSQLVIGLFQGVIMAVVVASSHLLYITDHSMTWLDWWDNVIIYAPVFGLCVILLHLLKAIGWIVDPQMPAVPIPLSWIPQKLKQINLHHVINGLLVGIVVALGSTLSDVITGGLSQLWADGPTDFILFVLATSILSFGLARLKIRDEIQPVDIRFFSPSQFWQRLTNMQHIFTSLVIGACFSCIFPFIPASALDEGFINTFQSQHGENITYGFDAALIYWLLFGFYSSLSSNILARKWDWHIYPNQSIKLSGRNSLIFGTVFGCLWWLITIFASLNQGTTVAVQAGKTYGLLVGVAGGLFFGMAIGGIAYTQHYILRILLAKGGIIQFKYIDMLNEAVDKMLLRRIGGTYIFIHPLFQNYLASL